jgi:TonB family protein
MSIVEAHRMNVSKIGLIGGIKGLGTVLVAGALFCGAAAVAGQSVSNASAEQSTDSVRSSSPALGVEILSDTQGANFTPYLKHAIPMVKASWIGVLPDEAPASLNGETVIHVTINPDGKISAMHLDGSSGQVKFDHAAWASITKIGQFPPLPKDFSDANLELRIHFSVNRSTTTP